MRRLLVTAMVLTLSTPAFGVVIQNTKAETKECDDAGKELVASGAAAAPAQELPLSFFGVGLGAINDLGDDERVADAAVVDGKIVILEDDNVVLGPILEAHGYVFNLKKHWAVRNGARRGQRVHSYRCWMDVWLPDVPRQHKLELGRRVYVGTRLSHTGERLEEGKALPAGETAIRYRKTSQEGLALVISFGF